MGKRQLETILTKEFLTKELIQNKKSMTSLAKEIGCCKTSIRYYLRLYEIKVIKPDYSKIVTKEILQEEFINKGRRIKEIANDLGVPRYIIDNKIVYYGLPRHPNVDYSKLTKEYLYDLYISQELSQLEIAKILNVRNCLVIREKLKEFNIPIRKRYCRSHPNNNHEEITSYYWSSIKNGAKYRNIKFNLTIEEAWDIFLKQEKKCAISGLDIVFGKYGSQIECSSFHNLQTCSLDRIDSEKDYSIDNVQWVHKNVNLMKRDMKQDEFITLCKTIGKYNDI